jgi:hypothetical protein
MRNHNRLKVFAGQWIPRCSYLMGIAGLATVASGTASAANVTIYAVNEVSTMDSWNLGWIPPNPAQ